MRKLLIFPLLLLFGALAAEAEPVEAPAGMDLTPATAVVEIATPPGARMRVIAAPGAAAGVARSLAAGLEAERAELEALLGGLDAGTMELRFAYGRDEFAALQPRGGKVPGWAAGVAWPGLGLVVIDAQASGRGGDVRSVLRHELAHVALGRLVQGPMPRWFTEGFAQLYAGEWSLSRSTTLARATAAGALIPMRELEDGWPSSPTDVDLAYAQSVSLVSHLSAGDDRGALQRLVRRLGTGEVFADALPAATGQPLLLIEMDWKDTLRSRYGWLPFVTDANLVLGFGGVLLVIGAWRVRRRFRRRLAAMEDGPELEPSLGEADGDGLVHIVFPDGPRLDGDSGAPARQEHSLEGDDDLPPPSGWRH